MRILFFGPIAKSGRPAGGGFESANRKNIDVLRQNGVDVTEFGNPIIKRQFGAIAKLAYLKMFLVPFCLLRYVGRKDVIVHTTPLYNHLLWPSVLVVMMAKTAKLPLLLDIRAGSLIFLSQKKSVFWVRAVRYMLNNAKEITVEGKSYLKDIPEVFGVKKRILYFPNITFCRDIRYVPRVDKYINLIYFGRITKHKGIDLLLRMMPLLDDRFRLYLAGAICDDIKAKDLQIRNVFYLGSLSPAELKRTLQKMHFFLFPTKWFGEGQSNSLIEAMQQGLIPIVSEQGFNRDVVADCGPILSQGCTEEDYCDAVLKISQGDMGSMGKKAMKHITECHNIDIWIPWLINIYTDMIR